MGTPASAAPAGPADGVPGAAAIAAAARRKDPGLPVETAELLAHQVAQLRSEAAGDGAPFLARALMAANPDVGATACNVVATAAVEHLDRLEQADPA